MSGISSGIGLISGINTTELIEQLMTIERRPLQQLQARSTALDTRRTALLAVSAKVLAIKSSITNFDKTSFFRRFNATSSNAEALSATASTNAAVGDTSLRVHSLVSSHSVISRGFADATSSPVGSGTLTIESAKARVNPASRLDELSGGAGVRRGVIRITDRSGASADVDLRTAVTMDDVISAINASGLRVRASVAVGDHQRADGTTASGDRLVIEDTSGGVQALVVADVNGGSAAADLGIAGSASTGRLDGRDLVRLSDDTPLNLLNDGAGVERLRRGADLVFSTSHGSFNVSLTDILDTNTNLRVLNGGQGVRFGKIRVTDRSGKSVEIDLSDLSEQPRVTVDDVRRRINAATSAAGVAVTVTTVNSSFLVTDTSTPDKDKPKPLLVEDVSGFMAADLGIAGSNDTGGIFGRAVHRMTTMGDAIRAINFATGNDAQVEASISEDGKGISLRASGLDNLVTVSAGTDESGRASAAAAALGLTGAAFSATESFATRRLVGGLNTVLLQSLRGGRGIQAGAVTFTDRTGASATIDFTGDETLAEVIERINRQEGLSLTASVNFAGNGIALRDESGGQGAITVVDESGSLAADLGIAGTFNSESVGGANAQFRYVSRNTRLAELNGGRGVSLGNIRVTDSQGTVYSVNLATTLQTVGEVIDAIHRDTPDTISARVNDNGDGIIVTDTSGGTKPLTIADNGARAAADLRLAGAAASGRTFIDGSYESRVDIGAGDSLNDVARKVNAVGGGFTASVLNDGSFRPFSLTIASSVGGRGGELLFDTAGLDLGFQTLTRARDALVTIGDENSARPRLVSSATNRLTDVVQGVTIDLLSAKNEQITLSVAQDVDGIVENVQQFVDAYNEALDAIAEQTTFNADTLARGTLFGDSTVSTAQNRLLRTMLRSFGDSGASVSRLSSIGLRLSSGNRLAFDEDRFRQSYQESPRAVEELFTRETTGFADVLQSTIDGIAQDTNGLIPRQEAVLADQKELIADRVASLNILLEAKQRRLEAQFAALETALADLQRQQSSLGVLQQIAST